MRSIAIMNQKGGVGKTTSSVNISAALAGMGKKVLLMDLDPQAHASLHLGLEPRTKFKSVYDVLVSDLELRDVRQEMSENLWLIPSHLDLAAADFELAGVVGRELILRDKLANDDMKFDYIIIDCPPSLGVLTLNALTAVEEIIIPLQPHYLALHGLSKLLETIGLVAKRLNTRLHLSGIVLCMFETTSLAKEVAGDVGLFIGQQQDHKSAWAGARLYNTKIRRNVRLAEAPSFGQSIFQYDKSCNGAEDYLALAKEIVNQEQEKQENHEERNS